jgi:Prophage tail length tape measure protein
MADTTAVAIYKLGMDNQQYIASAKAAIGVSGELVASHERLVVSEEKVGGASRLSANAIQRKIEANDKAIQAERKYAEAIAFAARAEEQQVGTAQQRAMYLEQEAQKLKRTTDALAAKAKAERDAAQAAKDEEAATKNLARIEGEHAMALKNTAAALGQDRDALIASANAGNRHAAATLDMMNKIVGLNKELQSGKINLAGHAAEIDRVQAAYRNQTTAIATQEAAMRKSNTVTGLARHELINLSRQAQDVAVSLAGGQSIGRVLIEQGSQILDIFASSRAAIGDFFGQMMAWAGRVLTPMRLVVGGIGAFATVAATAAASWNAGQRDIEQALLGIGRASKATVGDINRIGDETSNAFKMSANEARQFASTLASTGKLGVEEIRALNNVGYETSLLFGKSLPEAAKLLADAFGDPIKGIDLLGEKIAITNERSIRDAVAQNDMLRARMLLLKDYKDGLNGVLENQSALGRAWTFFANQMSGGWDAFGRDIQKVLQLPVQDKVQELERLRASIDALQSKGVQLPGEGGTGVASRLLEQQVEAAVKLQVELDKVADAGNKAKASLEKIKLEKSILDVSPEIAKMRELENRAKALDKALDLALKADPQMLEALQQMGISIKQLELAADRARGSFVSMLSPAEKLTASFEAQKAAIEARTQSERLTAVEMAKSVELAGQELSSSERLLEIDRARQLEIAKIAAAHKDVMASLEEQLAVARATTEEEKRRAQYRADVGAGERAGYSSSQAEEQAAMKRKIADEQAAQSSRKAAAANDREAASSEKVIRVWAYGVEIFTGSASELAQAMYGLGSGMLDLKAKLAGIGTVEGAKSRSFQAYGIPGAGGTFGSKTGPLVGAAGMSTAYNPDPRTAFVIEEMYAKLYKMMQPATKEELAQKQEEAAQAARDAAQAAQAAAEAQHQAALDAQEAAKAQAEAAKAAREAQISRFDELVKETIATRLLQGETANQVNAAIEAGQIQFGTASTRFEAQLDLYRRAGASNAQIAADIRRGVIGEGAKPTELLAALDSLTDAVNSNTDAQLGLSPFYTSQGDRQLGYRGYTVQKGASNIPGTYGGSTTGVPSTGGISYSPGMGGGITGGVVNVGGSIAFENTPTGTTGAFGYVWGYVDGRWVPGKYGPDGKWAPLTGAELQAAQDKINAAYGPSNPYQFTGVTTPPKTYQFAKGGIMSAQGQMPLHSYQDGGIANRPQMAIFGEGSQPEAFVPLKGGKIPVTLANDNAAPGLQKAITAILTALAKQEDKPTITINAPLIHFAAEPTRDEVRASAFQAAQEMRRLMAG